MRGWSVPVCKKTIRPIKWWMFQLLVDGGLPELLTGRVVDVDTCGSVWVPGAVGISSQDAVVTVWISGAEGCGWLDYTRVWTSVQGVCLCKQGCSHFYSNKAEPLNKKKNNTSTEERNVNSTNYYWSLFVAFALQELRRILSSWSFLIIWVTNFLTRAK